MAKTDPDWPVPGDTGEWISAWKGFHDATLTHVAMDFDTHIFSAHLDLGYPRLGDEVNPSVVLAFAFPSHILIYTHVKEGAPEVMVPVSASPEERELMLREYRRKSFTGTLSVDELAAALAEDSLEVLEADYRIGSGAIELRLDGYLAGVNGSWLQIHARAESLRITADPGGDKTIEDVLAMGETAWDAWRKRNENRRSQGSPT